MKHRQRGSGPTWPAWNGRRACAVLLLAGAVGCGQRVTTAVASHEASFEAVFALTKEANALVAKVPERGTSAFPYCTPSEAHVFNREGHDIDIVGGHFLEMTTPLSRAIALREASAKPQKGMARVFGVKAGPSDLELLKKVDGIKHLVVIREHEASTENHIRADIFVVSGKPAKIVCAFPFAGAPQVYGSVGTVVGIETISVKKTGKVVAEREVRSGASDGSSAVGPSRNKLSTKLAKHLGLAWGLGGDDFELAKKAKAGKLAPPDGHRLSEVAEALDDHGMDGTNYDTSSAPFGSVKRWNSEGYPFLTDGVSVTLFDTNESAAIGPEQTVFVGADKGLADLLARTPFVGEKGLVARMKPLGWTLVQAPAAPKPVKATSAPSLDGSPPFSKGYRTYRAAFKKGASTLDVSVLDYGQAARTKRTGAVRVEGKKVLVVSGTSPYLGTAEDLAKIVAGK